MTTQVQVLKILQNSKKYLELLEKIERQAAKHAGYNFLLKNIPDFGPLQCTGLDTKIGYSEIRETLKQFGVVHNLDVIKGTAYATFDDPKPCHHLLNHMQLGQNILTSNVF